MYKNLIILAIFGAMSSFAFPPFNYLLLLIIGYIVLFYAIYKAESFRQSFYFGFVFGLGHFLIGTYWLFSIIEKNTLLEEIILIIIIISIIIILSLFFGFFGFFSYFFKEKYKNNIFWFLIIVPALGVLMEWLRSWLFTGFTWLNPADTLVNYGFESLLPVTGVLGICYVFYLMVTTVLYFLLEKNFKAFGVLVFITGSISLSLYFLQNLHYTEPLGNKLYTQLLQTHIDKKSKSQRYKVIKRIQHYQQLALQEPQADLSVWPESSMSTDYSMVYKHLKNGFLALQKDEVEVLYGAYKNHQNVLIQNSSNKVAYSKQHLMPFGEYTPSWLIKLQSLLPDFENDDLIVTKSPNRVNVNGTLLAPSICYELLFPDELRIRSINAQILLHISDLGWFDQSWAQSYLLNLARMRSIEHAKPMIYVVNYGKSAFISSKGKIEKIATNTQGVYALYHYVQPYTGITPYAKYGSIPIVVWSFFILLSYFILRRKRR